MTTPHPQTRRSTILNALLARGHATARELATDLSTDHATVSTYLYKLHLRGYLARRQEGGAFRYWVHGEVAPPEPTPESPGAPFVPLLAHGRPKHPPAALANETLVLLAIAREPGSTTAELGEVTGLSPTDLAHALRLLETCDAVVGERMGRDVCWRVA